MDPISAQKMESNTPTSWQLPTGRLTMWMYTNTSRNSPSRAWHAAERAVASIRKGRWKSPGVQGVHHFFAKPARAPAQLNCEGFLRLASQSPKLRLLVRWLDERRQ